MKSRNQRKMRMVIHVASVSFGSVELEIRDSSPTGKILGVCHVPSTGGWDRYQTVDCTLKIGAGMTGLSLVPKGGSGELLRLDWFSLQSAGIRQSN